MGFCPSPKWAVRFYYLAEEIIRGDHTDLHNPLRWDEVVLNLPGNSKFNPDLPYVMKWDSTFNRIVGDVKAFVDDLRSIDVVKNMYGRLSGT